MFEKLTSSKEIYLTRSEDPVQDPRCVSDVHGKLWFLRGARRKRDGDKESISRAAKMVAGL